MSRSKYQSVSDPSGIRLQKVLASAGYGSRRQCEELIETGRVEIDRQTVTELGTRVSPDNQQIRVDGVVVQLPRFKYFMLHKPVGVVSTARDPWARTRVIDLVDDPDRLFTVGRLDKNSSGLILVTNDGELANQLAHPRYGVKKRYRVTVAGKPEHADLEALRKGVHLAEGVAKVERIRIRHSNKRRSVLEIELAEGRNREIRRLLARIGHKVLDLKRVSLGPLRLGELPIGAFRALDRQELNMLRNAASGREKRAAGPNRRNSKRSRGEASKQTNASRANAEPRNAGRPGKSRDKHGRRAKGVVIGATADRRGPQKADRRRSR